MAHSVSTQAPHGQAPHLVRRARWLAIVPLVAAVLLSIGMVAQWVSHDVRMAMLASTWAITGPVQPEAAEYPAVFWPVFLNTVPVLVFVATMLVLHQLFRRLAQGVVLDARNAQLVSRVGLGFLVFAVTAIFSNTLSTLVLSMNNPPGERILSIGFTTSDIGAFAAGFAFWGLGLVLGEAARIADDHASIV